MILDPLFLALAVPSVILAGVSKAGFGGGLGVLGVLLMSMAASPLVATAVMLPILCAIDIFGVYVYRGKWHKPNMYILIPAAMVGIAIGTASFRYLDASLIRILIGLVAISFALNFWLRRPDPNIPAREPSILRGGFWGALSGFTSFVTHGGNPPVAIYLLPQRLDKTTYVATITILFIFVNYAKLLPYAWIGQFTHENLLTSLALLPLVPVGVFIGFWAHKRVPEKLFYRVIYIFLFAAGAKQLVDGVMAQL